MKIRNQNQIKKLWPLACLCLPLLVSGCASYYAVTDPVSKKVYYTKDVDDKKSGAVVFKDAQTGHKVTLQNSEVRKINHSEFKEAVPK